MIYCLGPLAALVDRKVFYECLDDNDELTLGKNMKSKVIYNRVGLAFSNITFRKVLRSQKRCTFFKAPDIKC